MQRRLPVFRAVVASVHFLRRGRRCGKALPRKNGDGFQQKNAGDRDKIFLELKNDQMREVALKQIQALALLG